MYSTLAGVGVAVGSGVGVNVKRGAFVGLGVLVGLWVGVGVGLMVGVPVGPMVTTGAGVPVKAGNGVSVGVGVSVPSAPWLPGNNVVTGTRLLFPLPFSSSSPGLILLVSTTFTVGVGVPVGLAGVHVFLQAPSIRIKGIQAVNITIL